MGYSNVAGDLNVYGTSTLSSLVVRGSTIHSGPITSSNTAYFANLFTSNLTVTGNFIVTSTNTQITNTLSIVNQGSATALFVNQNESAIHTHNVAEFYDYTQLAMVIDPHGNVAVHTASSPGYALSVVDGVSMDVLTLGTPLSASSGGTGTSTATPNQVFAGPSVGVLGAPPSFRALVNADLPSIISVSNVSANGAGLSSMSASNVSFGTLSTSVFPASGVTAGAYGSSANVSQISVDQYGRVTGASNVAITSSQWSSGTGNIYYIPYVGIGTSTVSANLTVAGNIYASNAIQTTNIFATLANVTTLNVSSIENVTQLVTGNIYSANALTTTNLFANTLTLANASSTINVIGSVTASTFYGALAGSNVASFLNVYSANALTTTNLFANTLTLANASSTINVIGSVTASTFYGALAGSNVASFLNIYSANALTTTNLFANTLTLANATSTINVIGSVTASTFYGALAGSNTGAFSNIYSANAVTTTNLTTAGFTSNATSTTFNFDTITIPFVYSTTQNVLSTSNVLTQSVVGSSGLTSLYVSGNVFVSNALTTVNLFANTLTLANATSVLSVTGNIYASNALQTNNVTASGTIYYNEDLFKRGPYLLPTTANSATIQAWISATCNAASQPTKSWWSTSPIPVYGNVATGPQGTTDYSGSVLLPDGRVLFVPRNASNVGFFNTSTGLFSAVSVSGITAQTDKFRGGVLVPNGNVVFVPYVTSNVGLFNPLTYAYSNIQVGAAGTNPFQGGVLSPTGNVIMVPRSSANIGVFNPTTLTLTNVGPIAGLNSSLFGSGVLLPNGNVVMSPLTAGGNIGMYNTYSLSATGFTNVGPVGSTGTWESGVLAPNGNVIFAHYNGGNVLVYNPTFVSSPISAGGFSNVITGAGNGGFQGSTLLPSGNVIFVPINASNVGMFDPVALTYSNCAQVGSGTGKFSGCSLVPDGRVVFVPSASANVGVLSTSTPAPVEFCRAPYFNKF